MFANCHEEESRFVFHLLVMLRRKQQDQHTQQQ
jgi:hypothetical protein